MTEPELTDLITAWTVLDERMRRHLVSHAFYLLGATKLRGGPFDGVAVPDAEAGQVRLYAGRGHMAVYEWDAKGRLMFVGAQKVTEGFTPNLCADEVKGWPPLENNDQPDMWAHYPTKGNATKQSPDEE